MGFIDGWRSGGRKQAPPKPPKVKPVIQQKAAPPKPAPKMPPPLGGNDVVRELQEVIAELNERRLEHAEAFESLVGLVRKHLGRKLDTEIENIRRS